jgi:hypothetical protein
LSGPGTISRHCPVSLSEEAPQWLHLRPRGDGALRVLLRAQRVEDSWSRGRAVTGGGSM